MERLIKGEFLMPLRNDDNTMAEYTFTTDAGWRVTEYRPFSVSYGVRNTPCLRPYGWECERRADDGAVRTEKSGERDAGGNPADLLAEMAGLRLRTDYLSWDTIRRLVEERVQIRDKNRKEILGRVSDVSGDIYCCHLIRTPDSLRRKSALEKTKLDLEKQARDEDVALWKDVTELRKELLQTHRQYQSARMRYTLTADTSLHDGDKEDGDPVGAGYMPRTETDNRTES